MALEDFTTYDEVDSGGDITVAANSLTVSSIRRDAVSYVAKDKGAGHFTDFIHHFKFTISAIDTSYQAYPSVVMWALANGEYTNQDMADNTDGISVGWATYVNGALTEYRIAFDDYSGNHHAYVAIPDAIPWTKYFTVKRTENSIYVYIYSDAARHNLEYTINIICTTDAFRYIHALASRDSLSAPDDWLSCVIEDLDLSAPDPYPPDAGSGPGPAAVSVALATATGSLDKG